MNSYPIAISPSLVGTYSGLTHSGGGFFYDEVLEYRVWCHPECGAPDRFNGEDYFFAFASFEEAHQFSKTHRGTESPLVLVRQIEWIDEPQKGVFVHCSTPRITEWRVEWLAYRKRLSTSISDFMEVREAA